MRVIEATSGRAALRVRVHLDETKTVPNETGDGEEPDPASVMELQWGKDVPTAVVIRETALLAKAEAERGGDGTRVDAIERADLEAAARSAPGRG